MSKHVTAALLKSLGWDREALTVFTKLGGDKRPLDADGWYEFMRQTSFCTNAARAILSPEVFTSYYATERALWTTFNKERQGGSLPHVSASFQEYNRNCAAAFVKALKEEN